LALKPETPHDLHSERLPFTQSHIETPATHISAAATIVFVPSIFQTSRYPLTTTSAMTTPIALPNLQHPQTQLA
jgi:hypothetical protein